MALSHQGIIHLLARLKYRRAEKTLTEYLFDPDGHPPADEVIYADLLCKGDLAVWIGREKHRKTNFVLQMAISASIGRDFLNFHYSLNQPLRILYVDYESKTTSLLTRYNAICNSMELSDEEREILK